MSNPNSSGVNTVDTDAETSSLNAQAIVDVNSAYSSPDTRATSEVARQKEAGAHSLSKPLELLRDLTKNRRQVPVNARKRQVV